MYIQYIHVLVWYANLVLTEETMCTCSIWIILARQKNPFSMIRGHWYYTEIYLERELGLFAKRKEVWCPACLDLNIFWSSNCTFLSNNLCHGLYFLYYSMVSKDDSAKPTLIVNGWIICMHCICTFSLFNKLISPYRLHINTCKTWISL